MLYVVLQRRQRELTESEAQAPPAQTQHTHHKHTIPTTHNYTTHLVDGLAVLLGPVDEKRRHDVAAEVLDGAGVEQERLRPAVRRRQRRRLARARAARRDDRDGLAGERPLHHGERHLLALGAVERQGPVELEKGAHDRARDRVAREAVVRKLLDLTHGVDLVDLVDG